MKGKVKVLALSSIMLLLAGCSSGNNSKKDTSSSSAESSKQVSNHYNQMIQQGVNQITKGDYDKAVNSFANAVDSSDKNSKAKSYLKQSKLLQEVQTNIEKNDLTSAENLLKKIKGVSGGSTAIVTKAEQLLNDANSSSVATTDSADSSTTSSAYSSESSNNDSSNTVSESNSTETDARTHKKAEDIRAAITQNQGFSVNALEAIPDDEIIEAASGGLATNIQMATAAENLMTAHPELRQEKNE